MKLPSGVEVKGKTLSEIADFIAVDMMTMESSYSDSSCTQAESLEDGHYEGEHETLPALSEADVTFLLEFIRIPTLLYLEKLRLSRSTLFDLHLKNKAWVDLQKPVCSYCGEELHDIYHARSVKLEWAEDRWIESDVYSSRFSCSRCNGDIAEDELDAMGRPHYQES